jgi:hypothetical protein
MKKWIDKDGNFYKLGSSVVIEGQRYFAPLSDEQMIAAGYTEYVEPTPPAPTPEELLEQKRTQKLSAIEQYDSSDIVNGFTVHIMNGETVVSEFDAWIDRETRADYKNSLDAAELLGRTEVTPVFNGTPITLSVQMAKVALAQVQIYANQCYNVTEQHKAAINAMDNWIDVDIFDITADYPQRLVFEVPVNIEQTSNEEVEEPSGNTEGTEAE